MFPVAAGLVCGIVLAEQARVPRWLAVGMIVACGAAIFVGRFRREFGAFVIIAAAGALGILGHHATAERPDSVGQLATERGRIVRVRGEVASEPRVQSKPDLVFGRWTYGEDQSVFALDVTAVDTADGMAPASGRLRVASSEVIIDLEIGDQVEVVGWLRALGGPQNPGGIDWGRFLHHQGIVAKLRVEHRDCVRRITGGRLSTSTVVQWVRTRARAWLLDELSTGAAESSGILEAMVLGQRVPSDRKLNEAFTRAGLLHFLAASGVNVGMAMWVAVIPFHLAGSSRRLSAIAMLVAALVYALIADPRPPILRATVFGVIWCTAAIARRGPSRLNWISLAVVILALASPRMIFDVGYQLSSAAVLGVVFVGPALASLWLDLRAYLSGGAALAEDVELRDLANAVDNQTGAGGIVTSACRSAARGIRAAFVASVGAWLAGLPIIVAVFGRLQPWAALNSVVALPTMTFLMSVGFAKVILSSVSPTLSRMLGWALAIVGPWNTRLVQLLSELPAASVSVPRVPPAVIVAWYAALLCLVLRETCRPRRTVEPTVPAPCSAPARLGARWTNRGLIASCIALAVFSTSWLATHRPRGQLRLTALAVGQGSANVLELPDGKVAIFDAGASGPFDIGTNTIVPFLRHRGITRVDRIYISHPNLDHFSGVLSVLDEVPCGPVVISEYFREGAAPKTPARHLLDELNRQGHPVENVETFGASWVEGGARFDLLHDGAAYADSRLTNDASLVIRVTHAGRSIMLTGDIEDAAQGHVVAFQNPQADVLVLPHHGGVDPSLPALIRAVNPSHTIRSAREPSEETTSGLSEIVGTRGLWNTADHGAIEVLIDETTFRIRPALTNRALRPEATGAASDK